MAVSDAARTADPAPATPTLQALRGCRTAPILAASAREVMRQELAQVMEPCAWFTIGVMAPSAAVALATLRLCEGALGWDALHPQELSVEAVEEHDTAIADPAHGVFLKGNQRTGSYLVRPESGLGEGILISGHHPDNPAVEDTWGPLPLNLFAQADA